MAELEKCPFCGGRPHFEYYGSFGKWGVKHTCKGGTGNERRISISASGFATEEEANEAWNKRAAEMQPVMTNEDRIHGARGRELAQILYSIDGADYCQNYLECGKLLDEEGGIPEERCIGCLEEWLKKPVKEDNK